MVKDEILRLVEMLDEYEVGKRDVVAGADVLFLSNDRFFFMGKPVNVTDTAMNQMTELCGIPRDFFYSVLNPVERSLIFNRLINERSAAPDRLFRFKGNTLYGVLSNKYRKLDNSLLKNALRKAKYIGLDLVPVKVILDPDHTKIRLVPSEMILGELSPMIEFTNSENGLGSMRFWGGVFRKICENGLIVAVGDEANMRWPHLGLGDFIVPDLAHILNRSMEYVFLLDRAKTRYLDTEKKAGVLAGVGGAFGPEAAEKVVESANREYHGGRTLFDLINSITRAAQAFPPKTQTAIERHAAELLAA